MKFNEIHRGIRLRRWVGVGGGSDNPHFYDTYYTFPVQSVTEEINAIGTFKGDK